MNYFDPEFAHSLRQCDPLLCCNVCVMHHNSGLASSSED